jgi:hypothetical protein
MPKKRSPKRGQQRTGRSNNHAQDRPEGSSSEDDAIDAAIRRSMEQSGMTRPPELLA